MSQISLIQQFSQLDVGNRFHWFCEPKQWSLDTASNRLLIEPDGETDFWQRTHYGFQNDNGHFLYTELDCDFCLSTQVQFHPVHQYDQAGLMIRVSPDCWVKTSIEFEPDGPNRLGAVVTNYGYSDWSTQNWPKSSNTIGLRISRHGSDFFVETSEDMQTWQQIRLGRLHDSAKGSKLAAGIYACSPTESGYRVEFTSISIVQLTND